MGIFKIFAKSTIRKLPERENTFEIGSVEYSTGNSAIISVDKNSGIQYNLNIDGQQPCLGIHMDSHRPPTIYQGIPQIPMNVNSISHLTNPFEQEFRSYYTSGKLNRGSLFHMKNALIAMSVHGHGNPDMDPRPEFLDAFNRFEGKLKIILPKSLGFIGLRIRQAEVVLQTETGEFILDASSGGVLKLFELTWQLFFFAEEHEGKFTVTMDEPENHLHPSLQRTILTNLLEAFPKAQFVVVTHSPFVVSAIRDSFCYVLDYSDSAANSRELEAEDLPETIRRIDSYKLDAVNKAGTASEILREVLGVPTTIPDWAETRTNQIILEMRTSSISENNLDELYDRLEAEGLISEYPNAVKELMEQSKK